MIMPFENVHRKHAFKPETVLTFVRVSLLSLPMQEYSKEAVAHVQKFLMKNEVPVNLFEVSSFSQARSNGFRNNVFGAIYFPIFVSPLLVASHT